MPEHIQYEDDDLFNPETHHESTDVPVRPLLWFIVIFIAFAVWGANERFHRLYLSVGSGLAALFMILFGLWRWVA